MSQNARKHRLSEPSKAVFDQISPLPKSLLASGLEYSLSDLSFSLASRNSRRTQCTKPWRRLSPPPWPPLQGCKTKKMQRTSAKRVGIDHAKTRSAHCLLLGSYPLPSLPKQTLHRLYSCHLFFCLLLGLPSCSLCLLSSLVLSSSGVHLIMRLSRTLLFDASFKVVI